jgi:hypothetical protein
MELPRFGAPEWLSAGRRFNATSTGDHAEGKSLTRSAAARP